MTAGQKVTDTFVTKCPHSSDCHGHAECRMASGKTIFCLLCKFDFSFYDCLHFIAIKLCDWHKSWQRISKESRRVVSRDVVHRFFFTTVEFVFFGLFQPNYCDTWNRIQCLEKIWCPACHSFPGVTCPMHFVLKFKTRKTLGIYGDNEWLLFDSKWFCCR